MVRGRLAAGKSVYYLNDMESWGYLWTDEIFVTLNRMGPGNPHGEESELCYYVDQSALDNVSVVIKPELEIFW